MEKLDKAKIMRVIVWGMEAKEKLIRKGKGIEAPVRVACPNTAHTDEKYITVRLHPNRRSPSGYHIHFACEDADCHYHLME